MKPENPVKTQSSFASEHKPKNKTFFHNLGLLPRRFAVLTFSKEVFPIGIRIDLRVLDLDIVTQELQQIA